MRSPVLSLSAAAIAVSCTDPVRPDAGRKGADPAPASTADGKAALAPTPADDSNAVSSEAAVAGARAPERAEPSWYSVDLIPHTKVVQNGRSETRADGTFSSAMVLQLEPEMTAEKCVGHLTEKIGASGASFGEVERGDDGRLTVRAELDAYRVTIVCGAAKGVPTAYVGYEWKP
jgi:hypothetical protein